MTLIPYPPAKLDALALRLVEMAANLSVISRAQREDPGPELQLHGQKVDEWLEKLSAWVLDAQVRHQRESFLQQGRRRAESSRAAETPPAPQTRVKKPRKRPKN